MVGRLLTYAKRTLTLFDLFSFPVRFNLHFRYIRYRELNKKNTGDLKMKNLTYAEILNQGKEVNVMGLWYDWFCSRKGLEGRGQRLLSAMRALKDSKLWDNEKTYVFFKNNCPMCYSLYDDFRVCDKETGDVLFTITPKKEGSDGVHATVWGHTNDFKDPLCKGSWKEVKNYLLAA